MAVPFPTGTMALQVQRAIYQTLSANAALTAAGITGVFDYVPDDQPYPYVTTGTVIETAVNTLDQLGRELVQSLHVWTQGNADNPDFGFSQGINISNGVIQALDNANLRVGSGSVWRCQYEDLHTIREPDGITMHIVIAFRIGAELGTA